MLSDVVRWCQMVSDGVRMVSDGIRKVEYVVKKVSYGGRKVSSRHLHEHGLSNKKYTQNPVCYA